MKITSTEAAYRGSAPKASKSTEARADEKSESAANEKRYDRYEQVGGSRRAEMLSAGLEYLGSLKDKIPGTAFFIGTVSCGQTYGNSRDNNFVVDPRYLEKLSSDPEERRKFEESVNNLNEFSKQFRKNQAAQGREVLSEGWFCDENGNWGGWSVTRTVRGRSHLQEMREEADKIYEKKAERKKELEKAAEKRAEKKEEEMRIKEGADISDDFSHQKTYSKMR